MKFFSKACRSKRSTEQAGTNDAEHRDRNYGLVGGFADPCRLRIADRRQAPGPKPGLSVDERARRDRFRRQFGLERGNTLGGLECRLGWHRIGSTMADRASQGLIDLSHVIEHGMTTHKGLPGPHICDYWTREVSAANYDDGATFQIGRIEMVANTGTYVDSPFHRYPDGKDLSELPLESMADLDGLVVRRAFEDGLGVDA